MFVLSELCGFKRFPDIYHLWVLRKRLQRAGFVVFAIAKKQRTTSNNKHESEASHRIQISLAGVPASI